MEKYDVYIYENGDVTRFVNNKVRKLAHLFCRAGYPRVQPVFKGKRFNLSIHRLIAEAFIPNPENKAEVNHKDGNKKNFSLANLEWSTKQENMTHALNTGLWKRENGGRPYDQAKLKRDEEIMRMFSAGLTRREISNHLGVHYANVSRIVRK